MKTTFNQLKTMLEDIDECISFIRSMIDYKKSDDFNIPISKTVEYLKAYKDYLQYEKEWE